VIEAGEGEKFYLKGGFSRIKNGWGGGVTIQPHARRRRDWGTVLPRLGVVSIRYHQNQDAGNQEDNYSGGSGGGEWSEKKSRKRGRSRRGGRSGAFQHCPWFYSKPAVYIMRLQSIFDQRESPASRKAIGVGGSLCGHGEREGGGPIGRIECHLWGPPMVRAGGLISVAMVSDSKHMEGMYTPKGGGQLDSTMSS